MVKLVPNAYLLVRPPGAAPALVPAVVRVSTEELEVVLADDARSYLAGVGESGALTLRLIRTNGDAHPPAPAPEAPVGRTLRERAHAAGVCGELARRHAGRVVCVGKPGHRGRHRFEPVAEHPEFLAP